MLYRKLGGLIVVASALTIAACNDTNSPLFSAPPAPTPPATPQPTTAGSFATNQITTLTCINGQAVDINAVTFADSETPIDVAALTPGCQGGPPT